MKKAIVCLCILIGFIISESTAIFNFYDDATKIFHVLFDEEFASVDYQVQTFNEDYKDVLTKSAKEAGINFFIFEAGMDNEITVYYYYTDQELVNELPLKQSVDVEVINQQAYPLSLLTNNFTLYPFSNLTYEPSRIIAFAKNKEQLVLFEKLVNENNAIQRDEMFRTISLDHDSFLQIGFSEIFNNKVNFVLLCLFALLLILYGYSQRRNHVIKVLQGYSIHRLLSDDLSSFLIWCLLGLWGGSILYHIVNQVQSIQGYFSFIYLFIPFLLISGLVEFILFFYYWCLHPIFILKNQNHNEFLSLTLTIFKVFIIFVFVMPFILVIQSLEEIRNIKTVFENKKEIYQDLYIVDIQDYEYMYSFDALELYQILNNQFNVICFSAQRDFSSFYQPNIDEYIIHINQNYLDWLQLPFEIDNNTYIVSTDLYRTIFDLSKKKDDEVYPYIFGEREHPQVIHSYHPIVPIQLNHPNVPLLIDSYILEEVPSIIGLTYYIHTLDVETVQKELNTEFKEGVFLLRSINDQMVLMMDASLNIVWKYIIDLLIIGSFFLVLMIIIYKMYYDQVKSAIMTKYLVGIKPFRTFFIYYIIQVVVTMITIGIIATLLAPSIVYLGIFLFIIDTISLWICLKGIELHTIQILKQNN